MNGEWDIFQQMEFLRREIDGLLGRGSAGNRIPPSFRWSFLPGRSSRQYPLLNVSEDDDHVYVDALTPGLNPDSLNISVMGDQLSIMGEKPSLNNEIKPEAYHRSERAAGRFTRNVTLSGTVDHEKATADYSNGLLSIKMPKVPEAKPKQIAVKSD